MKLVIKSFVLIGIALSLQSCALPAAAGLSSQGQPVKKVKLPLISTTQGSSVNVDHTQWDGLLKKYVDEEGWVDYKGFKNDHKILTEYLAMLSSQPPTKQWSVQELLAYYINSYNAHTVNLILGHYPLKSIKDIDGPWTKAIVPIGNNTLSLGGLENGVLRKMDEPRIHFAINCASISCPKLFNEAFTAVKINEQLDKVTRQFINGNKNNLQENKVALSSIFKWYQKDFQVNGKQDVIAFINQYSKVRIAKDIPIEYLEYNWSLNER